MAQSAWLILASLAGLSGVGVLRVSWSRHQRSRAMNILGWLLILGAAVCAAGLAGIWGLAIVVLSPMIGALTLLAAAAISSAPAKVRAPTRPTNAGSDGRVPVRLAARGFTFLLVAVLAAMLGLGIATTSSELALLGGAPKSDAYATAMFMMPLAWSVLAFALLMQPHRRGQMKVLAIASIAAWPGLAAGLLS